jgi:hypothetical protein
MVATLRSRRGAWAVLGVSAVLAMSALPADAASWSTAAKHADDPHPAQPTQLWRVRIANDGTFDRIVIDERFSKSGYDVRYVHAVHRDPSGKKVNLEGRYFLSVVVHDAGTDGAAGAPTDVHASYSPELPEIRQVKKTGEFESVVSFGVGLRHKRDFRVLRLHSPLRLVIDVKH